MTDAEGRFTVVVPPGSRVELVAGRSSIGADSVETERRSDGYLADAGATDVVLEIRPRSDGER